MLHSLKIGNGEIENNIFLGRQSGITDKASLIMIAKAFN